MAHSVGIDDEVPARDSLCCWPHPVGFGTITFGEARDPSSQVGGAAGAHLLPHVEETEGTACCKLSGSAISMIMITVQCIPRPCATRSILRERFPS